jgi:hypothetical protein
LGEGKAERIYREDVFDCTSFVLTVVARLHSGERSAAEMMKRIHYHPPGKVAFANRLHFTSYRNRVSPYFEDITFEVGGCLTRRVRVLLNRKRPKKGRLVPIEWEREVVVAYIPASGLSEIIQDLPDVAGAAFVRRTRFEQGLGIVHEGLVLDGRWLVHASSARGRVVRVRLLDYLERRDYTGVAFYALK